MANSNNAANNTTKNPNNSLNLSNVKVAYATTKNVVARTSAGKVITFASGNAKKFDCKSIVGKRVFEARKAVAEFNAANPVASPPAKTVVKKAAKPAVKKAAKPVKENTVKQTKKPVKKTAAKGKGKGIVAKTKAQVSKVVDKLTVPSWYHVDANNKIAVGEEFLDFVATPAAWGINKLSGGHATRNRLGFHLTNAAGLAVTTYAGYYFFGVGGAAIAGTATLAATILRHKEYRSAVADAATFMVGLVAKKTQKPGKKAEWTGLVPFIWTKAVAIAKAIGTSAEWVAKNIFVAGWERAAEFGNWTAAQWNAAIDAITNAYNTPSWKVAKAN